MSFKVLVADDSLTIQKVIGITLANSGYELVECLNETDLMIKVKDTQYDLILLDFNLSDSKTGYDLAKAIKTHQTSTPVLILLGTFDTIEESKFEENGISDKIVKPFESSKFIKKCKQLVEDKLSGSADVKADFLEEKVQTEEAVTVDALDSWTVDAPKKSEETVEILETTSAFVTNTSDPLANEIQGWGFGSTTVQGSPSVIGEDDFPNITMPEKISSVETPDNNFVLNKLQSASNFSLDDDEDLVDDVTDPHMTITDEKREILEAVEEDLSPDSFWAVDDVQPVQSEETFRMDSPQLTLDDSTADLTETVEHFRAQEVQEAQVASSENVNNSVQNIVIDEDKIIRELKAHLTPLIEKWVKEACSETVEKVAWDVIPDLAENLIRKEIKELSDSVRH